MNKENTIQASTASPTRSSYWDNMKGLLIFLVVLGHFLLSLSGKSGTLAAWIYLFHMPAFIFIAGYLSSRRSLRTGAMLKLVMLYLLLQYGMLPFRYGWHPSLYTLTEGNFSSWFLLALIFYRLTLPVLDHCRTGIVLAGALALSLIIGFYPELGAWVLYKIIALWPFFIAGYMLRKRMPVTEHLRLGLSAKLLCLAGALLLAVAGWWLVSHGVLTSRNWMWASYEYLRDLPFRVVMLGGGFAAVFFLLALTPVRRLPFITTWGATSLVIYVLHRPISVLYDMYLGDTNGIWHAAAAVLCILVLGNRFVSEPFNKLVSFLSEGLASRRGKLGTVTAWGVLGMLLALFCLSPAKRIYERLLHGAPHEAQTAPAVLPTSPGEGADEA